MQAIAGLALGTTSARAETVRSITLKPADDAVQTVFSPYYKMGGILRFIVYDGAVNDDADARKAIHEALSRIGTVDDSALSALHPRRLSEAHFFGDWYDPSSGNLVWNGEVITSDGRQLKRPTFRALNGIKIASASASPPGVGLGGQFAYAFANPPYPLRGSRDRVQQIFDVIRHTLLPLGHACVIIDWTSPRLDEVSAYFAPGKKWWGMFLFTVRDATTGRITVIIGSAND